MKPNWEAFFASLSIMWKGMLGIFVTIGIIMFIITLLTKWGNNIKTQERKLQKMDQNNIPVEASTPIDDLSKFNAIYLLAVLGFFLGLISADGGIGPALGVSIFGLAIAYAIKSLIARTKLLQLRNIEFSLPEDFSVENAYQKVVLELSQENIFVSWKNDTLSFQSENITYDFNYNPQRQTFTLWWSFSLGKAFFDKRDITNYGKVASAMGKIVFAIQHTTQTNSVS